jgi:hypothetical protein
MIISRKFASVDKAKTIKENVTPNVVLYVKGIINKGANMYI